MSILIPLWATRKHRGRRFHCLECQGWLFRKYNGTRIHRECWLSIEAGINDG